MLEPPELVQKHPTELGPTGALSCALTCTGQGTCWPFERRMHSNTLRTYYALGRASSHRACIPAACVAHQCSRVVRAGSLHLANAREPLLPCTLYKVRALKCPEYFLLRFSFRFLLFPFLPCCAGYFCTLHTLLSSLLVFDVFT